MIAEQSKAFFFHFGKHCWAFKLLWWRNKTQWKAESPHLISTHFVLLKSCKRTTDLPTGEPNKFGGECGRRRHLTRVLQQPGNSRAEWYFCGADLARAGELDSPEEAEEHKGCTVPQFPPLQLGPVPSTDKPWGCMCSPSLLPAAAVHSSTQINLNRSVVALLFNCF